MAHDRIEMNPDVPGGKPVIRGTRVPPNKMAAFERGHRYIW